MAMEHPSLFLMLLLKKARDEMHEQQLCHKVNLIYNWTIIIRVRLQLSSPRASVLSQSSLSLLLTIHNSHR